VAHVQFYSIHAANRRWDFQEAVLNGASACFKTKPGISKYPPFTTPRSSTESGAPENAAMRYHHNLR
jgi:hypothetical protein